MQGVFANHKLKEGTGSLINKDFFPGLNELRAIAILCVIPGHVEQLKSKFELPYSYWFPVPGVLGVVLFFVLSGFLITALLIKEKEKFGSVSLRDFYARRILRIWPLYFLLLFLAIFLFNRWEFVQLPGISENLPYQLTLQTALLLILVLPNFTFPIPYAGHLWSIGVEEQFYFVQPFVVRVSESARALLLVMAGAVFLKELLSALMPVFHSLGVSGLAALMQDQATYFGCIAMGCAGAVVCHAKPEWIRIVVHSRFVQAASVLALLVGLAVINVSGNERVIDFRWFAVVFVIIIINASTNTGNLLNLRNPILDYLGRISYGMYIYHVICIGISIALVSSFFSASINRVAFDGFVYVLSLSLTIIVATGSYFFFEKHFLNLKGKLAPGSKLRTLARPECSTGKAGIRTPE